MTQKYTEQGAPAKIIGQTAQGETIIQYINTAYNHEGDEYETDGRIEVYTGKLLEQRPKPDDNGTIAALKAERDKLASDISALRNEKASLVKEKEAMAVKLESISPTVSRVLKFVEGKFTHAVRISYDGPHIIEASDKSLFCEDYRENAIKLMTLFGDSKGDLTFKINDYRDGSGSWTRIELFESLEEAKAFAVQWCADYFAKFDKARSHGLNYILEKCNRYDILVPDEIRTLDRDQKLRAAESQAEKAEAELQKSRNLIAELQAAA